jgi:hypothetical protein
MSITVKVQLLREDGSFIADATMQTGDNDFYSLSALSAPSISEEALLDSILGVVGNWKTSK